MFEDIKLKEIVMFNGKVLQLTHGVSSTIMYRNILKLVCILSVPRHVPDRNTWLYTTWHIDKLQAP